MLMPGEAELIKHDLLSFYAVSGQKKERKKRKWKKNQGTSALEKQRKWRWMTMENVDIVNLYRFGENQKKISGWNKIKGHFFFISTSAGSQFMWE